MATLSPTATTEVSSGGVIAPDLIGASYPPTPTTTSLNAKQLEVRASEFVKQEKFNRSFRLPATEAHGELNVTYAVGGLDSADAPTMLFIGGMMGGRYLASVADYVGTKRGTRIIVIDRPGMGGSTPVKPSLRLPVWLETVPILMRTIKAKHVSVSAHSCGVIYALNTIYSMSWILPPSNRKLYLFSPWVSPDHSEMTLWSTASHLPSPLINGMTSIIRFANITITPAVHFSSVVAAPFSKTRRDIAEEIPKHERDDLCREYCGTSAAEAAMQSKVRIACVFSENIRGSDHEALLCLKKDVAGSWGPCDDYASFPDLLQTKMKEHHEREEGDEDTPNGASATTMKSNISASHDPFVVKVFWAEKDRMIGKKGEEFFDECFQRFTGDAQSGEGGHKSYLLYESEVVPGSDHDSVPLPQYGALSRMLEDVQRDQGKQT